MRLSLGGVVRVPEIQKERAGSEYDKEKIQERIAKFTGGIAVIKVGAVTEAELKEKKDRVDDALAAVKAAAEGGILPGGGVALIRASTHLAGLKGANSDQQLGVDILLGALSSPLKQMLLNAGKPHEAAGVLEKVTAATGAFGYNLRTEVFEDLVLAGVLDPVKVTKTALEVAAGVAGILLTTECAIIDTPVRAKE